MNVDDLHILTDAAASCGHRAVMLVVDHATGMLHVLSNGDMFEDDDETVVNVLRAALSESEIDRRDAMSRVTPVTGETMLSPDHWKEALDDAKANGREVVVVATYGLSVVMSVGNVEDPHRLRAIMKVAADMQEEVNGGN